MEVVKDVEGHMEAFRDSNCFVQQEAKFALAKIGYPAVKPLIKALLADENPVVRWRAAEALGDIEDRRAIKPLIRALYDEDSAVQWRAIEALVEIGEPAMKSLTQALNDPDENVRWSAARALEGIKSRQEMEDEERFNRTMEGSELVIEGVDDAWLWQLTERKRSLPQLVLPRSTIF